MHSYMSACLEFMCMFMFRMFRIVSACLEYKLIYKCMFRISMIFKLLLIFVSKFYLQFYIIACLKAVNHPANSNGLQ